MAKPGYRLALFATALALLVVMLGAYTRLTHAGLGCPDWPGCYGFIGVPQSAEQLAHAEQHYPQAPVEAHKGWNEMVHRYFAGSLGLLILALAIQALRRRREPGQPLKLPLLLLGLVTLQAQLRAHTVDRRYVAVVEGNLEGEKGTFDWPILEEGERRKRVAREGEAGIKAITDWKVVERFGIATGVPTSAAMRVRGTSSA